MTKYGKLIMQTQKMWKLFAMVTQIIVTLLILPTRQAAAIPPPSTDGEGNTGRGPIIQYARSALLSAEQQKTVVELAAKCGIKSVAKISTYVMHPSPFRGITVTGVEQIKGRVVSTQTLNIQFKSWLPPEQTPRKDDIQIGDFWAGKPFTRQQTILKVAMKEYRTGALHGLSIEESEAVFARLLEKKYTVDGEVRQESLNQIDWSRPQSFRKSGDVISVGFLHKAGEGSGFFELEIKLQGEKLIIQQVLQAVP